MTKKGMYVIGTSEVEKFINLQFITVEICSELLKKTMAKGSVVCKLIHFSHPDFDLLLFLRLSKTTEKSSLFNNLKQQTIKFLQLK